jgi:hypothetical protein
MNVAHVVVEIRSPPLVIAREARQLGDHPFGVVADRAIARNQIRIVVAEHGLVSAEASARVEVEEDRRAAQKGLPVPVELRGIVAPERWQQLTLAAGPLDERPGV